MTVLTKMPIITITYLISLLNLWQTNDKIKALMLDERIGKMAADLSGADGIRIWHDQALIKKPWANPTSWHLDTPFWSFSDRRALVYMGGAG
jgi:phytanoyl-CoA hydroxylase